MAEERTQAQEDRAMKSFTTKRDSQHLQAEV
jgi:hypothetical protein